MVLKWVISKMDEFFFYFLLTKSIKIAILIELTYLHVIKHIMRMLHETFTSLFYTFKIVLPIKKVYNLRPIILLLSAQKL